MMQLVTRNDIRQRPNANWVVIRYTLGSSSLLVLLSLSSQQNTLAE
jgi:hypothetical protein